MNLTATGLPERSIRAIATPTRNVVRLISIAFGVLVLGSGLDAYAVGPVPVPWLISAGSCGLALVLMLLTRHFVRVPGDWIVLLFLGWISIIGLANLAVHHEHGRAMPPVATTPHGIYIGLRLLEYLVFLAVVQIVFWLLSQGRAREVLRYLSTAGVLLAIAALYIYIAPLYGLPEPPRTRIGTAGRGEQVLEFTYAFHRAIGTFREPSHLAEWLVVPLFASILLKGRWLNARTILIAWALLLTGSLTGIVGAAGGFMLAAASRIRRLETVKGLAKFAFLLIAALLLFDLIVRASGDGAEQGIVAVLGERLQPILFEGGMRETNRGYIYEYIAANPPTAFGVGLGNANIRLAEGLGNGVMATYLSLYFNLLYAAGPIAVSLLGLVLAWPILLTIRGRAEKTEHVVLLLAPYLAWLIMFAVHAESLTFMFAVAYGLLVYESQRQRQMTELRGAPNTLVGAPERTTPPTTFRYRPVPLSAVSSLVRKRWAVLVGVPIMAVVILAGIALARPRTYTADISFIRESHTVETAVAKTIETVGLVPGTRRPPEFYAALVSTREVQGAVVESEFSWSEPGGSRQGTLVDYYSTDGRSDSHAREEAIRALERNTVVTLDEMTRLVTVAVTSRDPQLSRQIAERLVMEAAELDRRTARGLATAEVGFLEHRLKEAQREVDRSERALQAYLEETRLPASSPASTLLQRRLRSQLERNQQQQGQLARLYELAQIAQVRIAPAITVVDQPTGHVPPNSRALVDITFLAGLYGLILALCLTLSREFVRGVRARALGEHSRYNVAGNPRARVS